MVFQKKGGAKVKQQTPAKQKNKKNEDESMDAFFEGDSDSDDSESEQEMVKKTPGKTPKGKQNQNDKRVSFQIPGKNTPNKNSLSKQGTPTPNKNQVVKKQATPAKTNLKEFKGLLANDSAKKNGKQSKKQEESDDDDDDDDEDDDEDMEDDADLDMLLGGEDEDEEDDDDDDEDDEEDDDDDDDDDEEEEEEEQISPKKNQSKQSQTPSSKKEQSFAQNKTPVKNAGNTVIKEEKTPKDKTPKKSEKTPAKTVDKSPVKQEAKSNETPKTLKQAHELGEERIRERDSKTLYIGSLPGDITPTEIKTLSNDILNVTIPRVKDKKKRKYTYAFLEFASEAKAEENYKILKSKKLRGQPITIDYTGHKRQNQKGESVLDPQSMNMKKLYVSNLPLDATIDKVASMFPKAFQVQMNISPLFRSASINFHTEELAAEAMTASKDFKLNGLPVTVLYSNSKDQQKKRKRKNKSKNKNQPQKKVKLEIKQESDDDDDDDDDDDEDEE